MMDPTVAPDAKSWVPYEADTHFPIQNLPYGVFAPTSRDEPRVCTRIGDFVLDLAVIQNAGLFDSAGLPEGIFSYPVLNPFMELDAELRRRVRMLIHGLLRAEEPTLRDDPVLRGRALLPVGSILVGVPVAIGPIADATGTPSIGHDDVGAFYPAMGDDVAKWVARSLRADPDVLVLEGPTSAVDAHTEAAIASAMTNIRTGRTTVVTTTSPLVLTALDEVVLLADDRLVTRGRHADLMSDLRYRAVVTREDS